MIKILPQNIVNQIAAGEIVERPASVVKELIENSLDAGSKCITVEIDQGGKKLIKIIDNGFGMEPEDLKKSILPHATSKIYDLEDLYQITSLGFRGEALSSISAVSQFSIASRTKNNFKGYELALEIPASKNIQFSIKPVALNIGTTVICQNLFYNIPARRKFLKSDQSEFSHILEMFINSALINPQVAFKLKHNQKLIHQLQADSVWEKRLSNLLGQNLLSEMLEINFSAGDFNVKGYVSQPQKAEPRPKHQYIFINQRPVRDFLILKAVRESFSNLISETLQPNIILSLTLDSKQIDVNVHPRKSEVRHKNPGQIFAFILAAIQSSLPKFSISSQTEIKPNALCSDFDSKNKFAFHQLAKNKSDFNQRTFKAFQNFKLDIKSPLLSKVSDVSNFTYSPFSLTEKQDIKLQIDWRLLGQIHNAYLIIEIRKGLILLDQHAAHERINYEELMRQFNNCQSIKKQLLALPSIFELSAREKNILETHLKDLQVLGFEIEHFGGQSFRVFSVPSHIKTDAPVGLIKEIVYDLAEKVDYNSSLLSKHNRYSAPCNPHSKENASEKFIEGDKKLQDFSQINNSNHKDRQKRIIKLIACHSAVKFGQALKFEEQEELVKAWQESDYNQTCPHGRPIFYQITLDELAKIFNR